MKDTLSLPSPAVLAAELAWMRGRRWIRAPMARHTSLRVGGPADVLVVPASLEELRALVAWSGERGIPLTWLGNGTNLVVRAVGIRGIVVSLRDSLDRLAVVEPDVPERARPGEGVQVRAGAGVALTRLLHLAIREGLSGLAFAVGVPGTVGGAIVMNAGTDRGAIWEAVQSVRVLFPDGRIAELGPNEVPFGYRFARLPAGCVVLEATLRAVKGDAAEVREEIRHLYACRRLTQPLAQPNAGSVFKNPPGERAGRLIDALGLKGYRIGGAQISPKHANFIVNLGQATSEEVLGLIEHIKRYVHIHAGVLLEEEVHIVGE